MKSYTITEEQIKELDKWNLSEISGILKEWFPEFFETKLEVGKWYKNNKSLFLILDFENDIYTACGFQDNKWLDKGSFTSEHIINDVLATKEEVEQELIKEAERRGFKEGVKYENVGFNKNKCFLKKFNLLNFHKDKNILTDGFGGSIFCNGKWAEIIEDKKEMTIEEIEKQLGYSIKIVNYETK